MAQGKKLLNKNKKSKAGGAVKKQLGKTKKGLKKQVKPRKENQIISKTVNFHFLSFKGINFVFPGSTKSYESD